MDFNEKVCVVTGGANGIGRCIAQRLMEAGAEVAVADADRISGKMLKSRYGGKLFFYEGDIADKAVLESFAGGIKNRFGKVDYIVNNACISKKGLISGCSYEDFNYVLRVGVSAPYYLVLLLSGILAEGAAIVNISSTRDGMSQPDTESYTAAKGGIAALTHALAVSLAGKARVNAVSPGWIDTGAFQHMDGYEPQWSAEDKAQHPAGRIGRPDDIANMALFLLSDEAGFITGQNIAVDGGMTKQMVYHGDCGWEYKPE